MKKARAIVTAQGKFVSLDDLLASLKDPELLAECGTVLAIVHSDHGTTVQAVGVSIGYFISVCAGEVPRMPRLPPGVIKRAAGKRS